jgi:putative ATPase
VREVIDDAKKQNLFSGKSPILFIDEIHRFNKSQQDSLLHAVEKGWIVLIGATTENPSFEVVSALLSRSQVYILKSLSYEKLEELAEISLKKFNEEETTQFEIADKEAFIKYSGGDARKLINSIELVLSQFKNSRKRKLPTKMCFRFCKKQWHFMIKTESNITILFRLLSNLCVVLILMVRYIGSQE